MGKDHDLIATGQRSDMLTVGGEDAQLVDASTLHDGSEGTRVVEAAACILTVPLRSTTPPPSPPCRRRHHLALTSRPLSLSKREGTVEPSTVGT